MWQLKNNYKHMKYTKDAIVNEMDVTGMIPVFNHTDPEVAKNVLKAAFEGGIRVFEFTNRGGHSLGVFKELAIYAKTLDGLILGIGTIFSVEEARKFLEAGADFIVSPTFVPSVAAYCNGKDVLWIPGCGTATEIQNARELGAEVVKAFPGNVLGPAFISSVKAVFPDLKFMPTGGVEPTHENLKGWFDAGVTCVGMGSQLFKKQWINDGDFGMLQSKIVESLEIIKNLKKS